MEKQQKLKIPNQEKIWNKIAKEWQEYRKEPLPEVKQFLKTKQGKILDLGCGSGRNFIKSKNTVFYGLDFSDQMLEYAEKIAEKKKINAIFKKSQTDSLPFEADFFDSAIFISALQCIPSQELREKTLHELKRVLKPGAQALLSVWNKEQDRFKNKPKEILMKWKSEENKRYYYLYEKKELEDLLKLVGFQILETIEHTDSKYQKAIAIIIKKPI